VISTNDEMLPATLGMMIDDLALMAYYPDLDHAISRMFGDRCGGRLVECDGPPGMGDPPDRVY